ncbi:MAG: acireductone synthase [Alphaproteobacteria bacterium]
MIGAIVTDIEGTTGSIAFVRDVLFPYARSRLGAFVSARRNEPGVRLLLGDIARAAGDPAMTDAAIVANLERWIDEDRKVTALKTLQGLIWDEGYRQGDLRGHVYSDAVAALRAWAKAGVRLYVYSSGSVAAQKLLFGHSIAGDLTPLFSGYFDTRIGAKKDARSYRALAAEIGLPGAAILFLSDSPDELDAAAEAGFKTMQLARPEDGVLPSSRHPVAHSFAEIDIARI